MARTRAFIWSVAFMCTTISVGCSDETSVVVGARSAISYILSCQKEDGSFGPQNQPYGDLAWTFYATEALRLLEVPVPHREACARAIRDMVRGKRLPLWARYALFSARIAVEDTPDVREILPLRRQQRPDGGWGHPGEPSRLTETYWAVATLALAGARAANVKAAAQFVVDRLYRDGHFDELPRAQADSGASPRGDIWHTFCGVHVLRTLGYEVPWKREIIRWVRACQRGDGGFGPYPDASSGETSDLWYTYLAVSTLRALGAAPADSAEVVRFVNACQNRDGGFSDRPGGASRLAATAYAIETLAALSRDPARAIVPKTRPLKHLPSRMIRSWRVSHLYRGPAPGVSARRTSRWWPGLPFYPLGNDLATAMRYIGGRALTTEDSTLTRFAVVVMLPRTHVHTASGLARIGTVSLLFNGTSAKMREALQAAWNAAADTLYTGEYLRRVVHPLVSRGALVWAQLDGRDQMTDYLTMDALFGAHPSSEIGFIAALDDGTDLVRTSPWIARAVEHVSPGIAPAANPSRPNDRARVVWMGKATVDDLRRAMREGRVACIVLNPQGDASIYARADVVNALRERKSAWHWEEHVGNR